MPLSRSYLIDEELEDTIYKVYKEIDGFYFGRLDIRYPSWIELKEGVFSIIEFNGAVSEPNIFMIPNILFFMRGRKLQGI